MMREGLLWFDDDPRRRLEEKIQQAADRYRQKFGAAPDVCYVNDAAIERAETQVGDVRVLPASTVRPHHFLIGRAA
ncbi:MAG TPA: hypothetical protein VIK33_09595 [Anaerolineae bacterium]